MLIIAIPLLAVLLFLLLIWPRRTRVQVAPPGSGRRDDGPMIGEPFDGLWHAGAQPDDFKGGGGDFGGAGSSGDWSDGGDSGGDGGD